MKLRWRLNDKNGISEITLVYDMFTGTKKLFINDKKILSLKKDWDRKIDFKLHNDNYKLELIPEGYEYDGFLVTPEGNEIKRYNEKETIFKMPSWVILFIIIDMSIPIISVEALRPWIIGILASFINKKVCENPDIDTKYKLMASISISVVAWLTYYVFYMSVKSVGLHGGFIPLW